MLPPHFSPNAATQDKACELTASIDACEKQVEDEEQEEEEGHEHGFMGMAKDNPYRRHQSEPAKFNGGHGLKNCRQRPK